MKTRDVMTTEIASCRSLDTLNDAVRLMWDRDCGFALVVDASTGALAGVLSDRDACMAAYTRGRQLSEIPVASVMCQAVATCDPDDDLEAVHELMRSREVRRLPVVMDGRPVGVVSLNDLALVAGATDENEALADVGRTLASVCRPRQPQI